MIIRNARAEDFSAIRRLAETLELDYPGMESDRFWVAEDNGHIWGMVALLAHRDCLELVSLGVNPSARTAGLGGRLIEAVMEAAGGDVFLATIIPGYFERHGFVRIAAAPPGMAKDPAWCEGCPRERCTPMFRKKE